MTGAMKTAQSEVSPDSEQIRDSDLAHLLHPWAPIERARDEPLIFRSGRGITLTDIDGNEYLDAASGLINVNLGYGRDDLVAAAAEAIQQLSYGTLFYGRGSVPAARLASKLAEITPAGLNRFFFTVGGSDANDTVIKLVRHYNLLRGRPEKQHIIGRRQSYHGMTIGGWSLTGDEGLWKDFGERLPGFSHIDQPADAADAALLEEEILRIGPERVAAFVGEPISMPARINIPPDGYWQRIRAICDEYDVLLSIDEVITGFGRTGRMFAVEHWGVRPDFIQLSKGITSGYLPLGAVGVTDEVIDFIAAGGRLSHGFTSGGHVASCSVALATMEIMEREDLVERSAVAGAYLLRRLEELVERHDLFIRARGLGLLAAIDLDAGVDAEVRTRLAEGVLRRGVLVRPYDDRGTMGFAPSLVVTEAEVDEIVSRVDAAADAAA
jgi:adenosylmethionine-8-amino-7-oxononanoate aminotransferase